MIRRLQPIDVARLIVADYNQHEIEDILDRYRADATLVSPLYPDGVDRVEHAWFLRRMFLAFPDLHIEPEIIVEEDRRVAIEFHLTGTHRGVLDVDDDTMHPPTDRSFSVRGTVVQEFDRNNRVVAERSYWDTEALLGQLGIELNALT